MANELDPTAPKRRKNYRQRQAEIGRTQRNYYLTDDEAEQIKRFIEKIRSDE